jgi:hypothetical protein
MREYRMIDKNRFYNPGSSRKLVLISNLGQQQIFEAPGRCEKSFEELAGNHHRGTYIYIDCLSRFRFNNKTVQESRLRLRVLHKVH